jgi:hypothetical protein
VAISGHSDLFPNHANERPYGCATQGVVARCWYGIDPGVGWIFEIRFTVHRYYEIHAPGVSGTIVGKKYSYFPSIVLL